MTGSVKRLGEPVGPWNTFTKIVESGPVLRLLSKGLDPTFNCDRPSAIKDVDCLCTPVGSHLNLNIEFPVSVPMTGPGH